LPSADNTYALGSSSYRWSDVRTVLLNGWNPDAHASRHAYGGVDAIGSNALRFSQIDKVLGTATTVTIPAASTYTIPKGIYYARCGPYTRVDFYDGAAWNTVISTGGSGLIISDGSNVQAYNTSSSASDYIKLRPFT
jgi:hypothetical protein